MALLAFVLVALLAVGSALGLVLRRNPIHGALFLIVNLGCIAVFYLMLGAEFLAAAQVIVYAGAIMVLFLFVVMLLNAPHEDTDYDEKTHPLMRPGPRRFGALLAGVLIVELVWALTRRAESGVFAGGAVSSVSAIGRLLFTDYAFPFEVTSVLILVAMVGAVVLARREH
jgi:NADH-quinone oxidoreductase subunit J